MTSLNLKRTMQDDPSYKHKAEEYIAPTPPVFHFPEEALYITSAFNSALETTQFKVVGRQLTGNIIDLHNRIVVGNAAVKKAVLSSPEKIRCSAEKYGEQTVHATGNYLNMMLKEKIASITSRLVDAKKRRTLSLPSMWNEALKTLAELGVIHVHPDENGDYNKKLGMLSVEVLQALGLTEEQLPRYTPEQLARIEHLEDALKILESIRPFCKFVSEWTWGSSTEFTFVDPTPNMHHPLEWRIEEENKPSSEEKAVDVEAVPVDDTPPNERTAKKAKAKKRAKVRKIVK